MKTLITILLFALVAFSQDYRRKVPQTPALVKICGNVQVQEHHKLDLFLQMQAEGCENINFQYVADGFWIGWGTRVITGDAALKENEH